MRLGDLYAETVDFFVEYQNVCNQCTGQYSDYEVFFHGVGPRMEELNLDNLQNLQTFVDSQYDLIAAGSTSHAQALYDISNHAEQLNGGDFRQAIRDMALVIIGDDVSRPNAGQFRVSPSGRINGADGFRPQFQDESVQIIHTVAGLYMASEYGLLGTAAALAREAYTNYLRGEIEAADYALFLATELVEQNLTSEEMWGIFGQGRTTSLAEALRETVFNENEIKPPLCFGPEVPIDMWPLDPDLKPGPDGLYDQNAVRAKVWKKPIELIRVGDLVVSFDDDGNLVPGPVTRTFQNDAKILLNFHGTRVTPGHVYYRPDSKKAYKFETLIDVLRDDGVIKHQDGTLIRAATNVPVGSLLDGFVRAITQTRKADGTVEQKDEGRIRLGASFLVGTGKERKSFAVADLIKAGGGSVGKDELIYVDDGSGMPFLWDFSDALPKPEDFVLACSGTTLQDIYKAAEWEAQRPHMPPPMPCV
jgi:hypothetical protein